MHFFALFFSLLLFWIQTRDILKSINLFYIFLFISLSMFIIYIISVWSVIFQFHLSMPTFDLQILSLTMCKLFLVINYYASLNSNIFMWFLDRSYKNSLLCYRFIVHINYNKYMSQSNCNICNSHPFAFIPYVFLAIYIKLVWSCVCIYSTHCSLHIKIREIIWGFCYYVCPQYLVILIYDRQTTCRVLHLVRIALIWKWAVFCQGLLNISPRSKMEFSGTFLNC